jgi:hypothetical protein
MFRYRSVIVETASQGVRVRLSALAATVITPAALLLSPAAVADPGSTSDASAPVVDMAAPPLEAVDPAPEAAPPLEALDPAPEAAPVAEESLVVPAAHIAPAPHALPPGVAAEQGLQIETIEVARNVTADFPQIHSMIGVRPDAKPWHPSGKALDIMIPNPGSAEGIALGDAIISYALRNAARLGIQDVIWRGTYYTPAGPGGSGYGHFDHVHITTFGGGYPTGAEEYLSDGA